jgi:hypothetical protein
MGTIVVDIDLIAGIGWSHVLRGSGGVAEPDGRELGR